MYWIGVEYFKSIKSKKEFMRGIVNYIINVVYEEMKHETVSKKSKHM